jgi:hypothetical protein
LIFFPGLKEQVFSLYKKLNCCIIRPTFDSPTPFQAVWTIPTGMKFFTVIDALKGYHQVELDEESSAMMTFSTPLAATSTAVSRLASH